MSNIGSNAGSGLRGGVHSVHGSNDSAARNQAVSDRGVDEFQTGSRHNNPGSSFDKHPSDAYTSSGAGHQPGSSFDKHPSDVRTGGVTRNPAADSWGTSNTTSSTDAYGNPSSHNAGPHGSNVGNKVDPRIDSDLDNRGVPGSYNGSGAVSHSTSTSGGYGQSTSTHDGLTGSAAGSVPHGSTGSYGNPNSSNDGPHGSNVQNKMDPRFDSDRDNRGRTGNQTGAAAGPHSSNLLNKVDPRVDSDRDNRGAHSTGHSGSTGDYHTGPSKTGVTAGDPTGISRPSNAGFPTREDGRGNLTIAPGDSSSSNHGPHDSNAANKADPRFDSDRDNRAAHHDREELASDRHNNTTSTHPSTGAAGHHNVNAGVTPGSYGSEALETDNKHGRPDSGHAAAHNEYNTTHVNDGETAENKGSHPPHKSNLLNKLDPRVKNTPS